MNTAGPRVTGWDGTLLHEFEVDVAGYGPSPHDENSYSIIRAYRDLDHRTESHARFYGSDEWATGPRDRVLALIESYTTVVWMLDASALSALREQFAPQAPRGQP